MTTSARDTWEVITRPGALAELSAMFGRCFGDQPAMVIADENTWKAAGEKVEHIFAASGKAVRPLVLPGNPPLYAEMPHVDTIFSAIDERKLVPVAVGSGTMNDLVKLAAHRRGLAYMVVGTAASMDGYTAFGASISERGNKLTFTCPAPRAVLADIDVIAAAPAEMTATGFADLAAKFPAGADWIVADALGIEPIHEEAWGHVQVPLRGWLSDPAGVRRNDPKAIENLVTGLMASGTAMQITQTSRPGSGADHQFSHLWDMEGHRHQGQPVPHGSKVAIGTLSSTAMHEFLLSQPLDRLDIDAVVCGWPSLEEVEASFAALHSVPAIREKAVVETRAKYPTREVLRKRLVLVRKVWPELRLRLAKQIMPARELCEMLRAVGAPTTPEEIGLTRERLRRAFYQAYTLRRRYTCLDLAKETGVFDRGIETIFGAGGFWGR